MNRRRFLKRSAAISTVAAIAATGGCMREPRTLTPIIKTSAGHLQGEVLGSVHRFLGIPYADPPFGQLRWKSPVHRTAWKGVLNATEFGAVCPQTGGIRAGLPDEGEDCLNLNVWTPDLSNTANLPVMVWLHGGGQVSGSGASGLYDGTHFASDGVVLVTCNRRLGAEGYLYLEEVFGEGVGPGNLGIQDVICVLEWVAENINQFGGNPDNVTLFGESGGGAATQSVIATPGSEGLVRRAIIQSGGHAAQRVETASEIAQQTLKHLSIRSGDLNALRQTSWAQFVGAYEMLQQLENVGQPQVYLPVLNHHMPIHPVDAPFKGKGLDVDYLIGTCRDEANFFSMLLPEMEGSVFHQRATKVIESAGLSWQQVSELYARGRPRSKPGEIFNAILGDMWFRIPAIRIAEGHARHASASTYMYLFEWESPLIGAAHAMDLMVFGNGLPIPGMTALPGYEETAKLMRRAWISFATSGKPSTPELEWASYGVQRSTMSLNEQPKLLVDPYGGEIGLFEKIIQQTWDTLGL